jgi:hypothetical protein
MMLAKLFPSIRECSKLRSMKLLSAFFALFILVPVPAFALSNRQGVEVALWPFDGAAKKPFWERQA